jgi:hypothetical protein
MSDQSGVDDYPLIIHLWKIGETRICAESADFGVERKGDGMWTRAQVALGGIERLGRPPIRRLIALNGTVTGVFEKPGSGNLVREIPFQDGAKRRPRLVRQQLVDFEVPIRPSGQKK